MTKEILLEDSIKLGSNKKTFEFSMEYDYYYSLFEIKWGSGMSSSRTTRETIADWRKAINEVLPKIGKRAWRKQFVSICGSEIEKELRTKELIADNDTIKCKLLDDGSISVTIETTISY
jgi:hypothetical protein